MYELTEEKISFWEIMAEVKKKSEQEVMDDGPEDLEFSAKTAVLQMTPETQKALKESSAPGEDEEEGFTPQEFRPSASKGTVPIQKPHIGASKTPTPPPSQAARVPPPASSNGASRPAPATSASSAPKAPNMAELEKTLERTIEMQVGKVLQKMNLSNPGSDLRSTGNPELDRRIAYEVQKALEQNNREHAQRNKDLEMEIYYILRKYANHPEFAEDFDRIKQLLSEHSSAERKFYKKTG